MRKKVLVTITILAMVAALAAAFTGAQFENMTTSNDNLLTFGNVKCTNFSPVPLIDERKWVPGESRDIVLTLQPTGDVNQDIYIGLQNQAGYPSANAGFGHEVEVALYVQDVGWLWGGAYKDVHELYAEWQKIKGDTPSEAPFTVTVRMHVKDSLPSTFMGVSYSFKTFIFAVQAGGAPPSVIPYMWVPTP